MALPFTGCMAHNLRRAESGCPTCAFIADLELRLASANANVEAARRRVPRREPATSPCANPYHAQSGCVGRERECYDVARAPEAGWRVGSQVGRTIYDGPKGAGKIVGVMVGPEAEARALAAFVVAAVNARPTEAETAPRPPCAECKGRGWHHGDCHPRETCGVCDGTGLAPASPPPRATEPRCHACDQTLIAGFHYAMITAPPSPASPDPALDDASDHEGTTTTREP
jgi:hypothetical protein